jgi:gliding motility associated protien GldN
MKKILVTCVLMSVATAGLQAQSAYRRNNNQPPANAARKDTTVKPPVTQQPAGTGAKPATTTGTGNAPSGVGNVTVRFDTTTAGAFDAKPEVPLRNNSAVDHSMVKDRKPLEYDHIRMDDEFWKEVLWREIDAREKFNQTFLYPGKDDAGEDRRFFSILLGAIKNDSVTAFSPDNDRFTTPLTLDQVTNLTAGSYDTVEVPDPVSGAVEKVITKKPKFSPDSVYTFRIKEEMIFDKESSRMYTRIIGVAPIAKQVIGGKSTPRILFWIYYPDLRKTLARADVYNPNNAANRMTWEELFESRYFSSYIIKTSAKNPGDKYLNAIIKDPLFRLLEGENIKTRIFNYEQDLWQY